MANFPVKWFTDVMQGAPAFSGFPELGYSTADNYLNMVPGEVNSIFKDCLINGFGVLNPTDITYDGVSGKVTVTFPTSHSYLKDSVIQISNCDQVEYNGEFRITDITSNTFSYVPDSAPSVTPATTVSAFESKVPAVGGWEIEAEDLPTHHLVLRRTATDAANVSFLIKNDINYAQQDGFNYGSSYRSYAKVEMISNFVDFSTYDLIDTFWIPSWSYSSSNGSVTYDSDRLNRRYYLVADAYCFYWLPACTVYQAKLPFFFGDIVSCRPGDRGHAMGTSLNANTAGSWTSASSWSGGPYWNYPANGTYRTPISGGNTLATNYANTPGQTQCWVMQPMTWEGYTSQLLAYPNPANQGLFLSRESPIVLENTLSNSTTSNAAILRGFMPGMICCPQNDYYLDGLIFDNAPGFENTPILMLNILNYSNSTESLFVLRLDQWRSAAV